MEEARRKARREGLKKRGAAVGRGSTKNKGEARRGRRGAVVLVRGRRRRRGARQPQLLVEGAALRRMGLGNVLGALLVVEVTADTLTGVIRVELVEVVVPENTGVGGRHRVMVRGWQRGLH
jgi:hypothetical protein